MPLTADGVETSGAVTLAVDVIRVISIAQAQERGLINADDSVQLGQRLKLAWHPLGTDYLGRDMLARLMYGGQVSLFIGIFAPLAFVLLGVIYGSVSGFLGGATDQAMMRFADFCCGTALSAFRSCSKSFLASAPVKAASGPCWWP